MQLKRVVAKFRDGSIIKGESFDFYPQKTFFHVVRQDGVIVNIDAEKLKAVYVVKNFIGNKDYKDCYDDIILGGGQKLKVTFHDNETMIGYSLCYSSNRHGFFLTPADLHGNNKRIFIIKSALRNIEFLDGHAVSKNDSLHQHNYGAGGTVSTF